jgi:hypothetical protein
MSSVIARPIAIRPSVPARVAGPVLAGLGFVSLAVTQLVFPAQSRPFSRGTDYAIEWSYAAGLWAAVLAIVALHLAHRSVPGWGRTGAVGTAIYAAGHVLVGTAVATTAVRGDESLPMLFVPGLLGWMIGGVLCAVAAFRAGLLPRPLAVTLGLSLPLTMALGHAGPLVEGAVWFGVAAVLAVRARRA